MPAKLSHSIITKTLSSTLLTSALVACGGGSSGGDGNQSNEHAATAYGINIALISTSAEEPDKADITLATLEEDGSYTLSVGGTPRNQPNYNIARHGEYFYQIGGRDIDKLSKYHFESPTTPIFEDYSLLENPDDTTGSPRVMVFASQNKAYIPLSNSHEILIINPSAQSEAEMITGTLDLSVYAGVDGKARPSDAVLVGDKLFVALQRSGGWATGEREYAYIAVFDSISDTEIDTNPSDAPSNLRGIKLDTVNPEHFAWNEATGLLLQSAGARFLAAFDGLSGENFSYTGGITQVDTENYGLTTLVDDGEPANSPYGYIYNLAVVDAQNAYFISSSDEENYDLYHLNPSTGETKEVTGYTQLNISEIATDPQGRLWVGISAPSTPRIEILDAKQRLLSTLILDYPTNRILFTN
jgi:hypothetical protein